MPEPLKVALVAGEASGDALGAGLIRELREREPDAIFFGIGGPAMAAAGCECWRPMEDISLMGFDELLSRGPGIFRLRKDLARQLAQRKPDVFVGIDVPDFNLSLERKLRRQGTPAIHYVSPTVWAWRKYRVRRIRDSVSHMLTLFPFEARFYEEHGVPVTFVGHPLADRIPEEPDRNASRLQLGLSAEARVLALLPGSRQSELRRHAELFVESATWLARRDPELQFIATFVDDVTRDQFAAALQARPDAPDVRLWLRESAAVLGAADVALLASGTAALEAALLRTPMVVTYRLGWFSHWLVRRMANVKFFSMPNHLASEPVVPELIQDAATPEALGTLVRDLLDDPDRRARMGREFDAMYRDLRRGADQRAAQCVIRIARGEGCG
ncbi:MAG: lipid-A-disaccharide synthase [Gammaproteobacteria bacterium]|nr:lipid-A-disaccharide synthase [Gammaproteobacteria bacterium]